MTVFWCRSALIDGIARHGVRLTADGSGTIVAIEDADAPADGEVALGVVAPGFVNAHSHAFHRALRGRTHDQGGDFWRWRTQMYRVAGALDPDLYYTLATAVFAEMLASGYTAVGEFHYVHHRPDGHPYTDPTHAMERALVSAAQDTGIRITLLDTCYLAGGVGVPLSPEQRRFGDGTVERWAERWHSLSDALEDRQGAVRIGAAVHSVRAVPREDIARVVEELPADTPLHVHLSEQPRENEESQAAYGMTPTRVLAEAGALSARLSAVHATHLTGEDIALLGGSASSIVMCPTTEADLGDGIGPARELADAGARICIGSDQHVAIDPLLELRGLEAGERLRSGRRGRFTPRELWDAGTSAGSRALGWQGGIALGSVCDLVELDSASVRTAGMREDQLVLGATASDVRTVVVGGRVVAQQGVAQAGDPASLLQEALRRVDGRVSAG